MRMVEGVVEGVGMSAQGSLGSAPLMHKREQGSSWVVVDKGWLRDRVAERKPQQAPTERKQD